MNVEIGAEASLFPEKEYINGIAVAVHPAASHQMGFSPQCTSCRKNGKRRNKKTTIIISL
jgi:hypothetical protein